MSSYTHNLHNSTSSFPSIVTHSFCREVLVLLTRIVMWLDNLNQQDPPSLSIQFWECQREGMARSIGAWWSPRKVRPQTSHWFLISFQKTKGKEFKGAELGTGRHPGFGNVHIVIIPAKYSYSMIPRITLCLTCSFWTSLAWNQPQHMLREPGIPRRCVCGLTCWFVFGVGFFLVALVWC